MFSRARALVGPRRLLAAVVVAAALLAAGCFPSPPPSFLTCVRAHESGGNYTVDSRDGQYHGAYQFTRATWDGTAQHIGRTDLVGVDPHTAAPATQDDMAWALYQWQGTGPWAGSGC